MTIRSSSRNDGGAPNIAGGASRLHALSVDALAGVHGGALGGPDIEGGPGVSSPFGFTIGAPLRETSDPFAPYLADGQPDSYIYNDNNYPAGTGHLYGGYSGGDEHYDYQNDVPYQDEAPGGDSFYGDTGPIV